MDLATYAVEAEAELAHWWFAGRRRLYAREINRLALPKSSPIFVRPQRAIVQATG
jgi:hypothetical protein